MDHFYNTDAAAQKLEVLAAARREALKSRGDSQILHLADIDTESVGVVESFQGRRSWRICIKQGDDEVNDEIVIRLQGILTRNNLVPKNLASCPAAKVQFLTQNAEIHGAETATFKESMAKLDAIRELFAQHLVGVELVPIAERSSTTGNLFSASNRIFTLKSDSPTEQDNEFQLGVDPMRMLARKKTGDLIHAPDNIVKYFKRVAHKDHQPSHTYEDFIPGGFKVGDIVEMQVCIVAMASAKSTVKITTRLQALTLLDNKFSTEATIARKEAAIQPFRTAIRRKVGYFREDEEDEKRVKKSRSISPNDAEEMSQ
ncbi:hypothetical protein B0H13DRAFT_1861367 [Mycena leptocephala]|nr:hypothetical protein B0H13DRAFT_1861367 [Mycena leptocephala]